MYQAIKAPVIEDVRLGSSRRWENPEENKWEAGPGQVIEHTRLQTLPVAPPASIVSDDGEEMPSQAADVYFDRWLVEDGETVHPGKPLAEVVIHGTTVQVTSYLAGFVRGLVDWKEGDRINPGEIMANLATRFDQGSKKTGLNPKPSSAMYYARTGHFRVY